MALWQNRYSCVLSACNVTWTPAGKNIVLDFAVNDKEAKLSGGRNPFFLSLMKITLPQASSYVYKSFFANRPVQLLVLNQCM